MNLDNTISFMVKTEQAIPLYNKETGQTEVIVNDKRPIDTNKYSISTFEAMMLSERAAIACEQDYKTHTSRMAGF